MSSSHLALFLDEFAAPGAVGVDPGTVLAALHGLAGATSLVEMAEWAEDTAREQLSALGIGSRTRRRWAGSLNALMPTCWIVWLGHGCRRLSAFR
ncbi:hypothetical protein [Arthrobacter sp. A5]|uniref:hypothetical protein n=1 Tax=Arthrobacter sp. A5 TaxID=576926 RepID=UPI003DA9E24A